MIVTFQTTINPAADYTACFMNFLRCVTAIATASSGTSALVVNPYTASGVIDTTKNCIISIDANAEAGGWTTSTSHNVVSSLSNTATTYTALASATAYQYRADFYNVSGKSALPYKKLSFHSYGANNGYNPWNYPNNGSFTQANVTANAGANMLITFGASTSTDWTSTTFPPGGGPALGSNPNDGVNQRTSWTLNSWASNYGGAQNMPGLVYTDPVLQFHMAVTADYCIIWESRVGDSYTNGYFNSFTTNNGTSYWNTGKGGSIFYAGLRENQPWETPLSNNPPWVCWQHTQATTNGTAVGDPYPWNQVAASMITTNNSGVVGSTATVYATYNYFNSDYFHQYRNPTVRQSPTTDGRGAGYYTNYGNHQLDGPLFSTKQMYGTNPYNVSTLPGNAYDGTKQEIGNSANMLYMPQYDTASGVFVPGAWPIKISRCYTGDWNAGGACRGIYKSLSMPYATMQKYWTSASQTFTINGDQYLPFVQGDDMWLVRFA
jgi:hypothetical protein